VTPGKHSPLVGWAFDGFPIYALYGYADPQNPASAIVEMTSSYQLKEGNRPAPPDGPGGKHDGAFTDDYAYVKGAGTLDECNGRFSKTPDFPDGTYAYFLSNHWPVIYRHYRGTPAVREPGVPGAGGPPGAERLTHLTELYTTLAKFDADKDGTLSREEGEALQKAVDMPLFNLAWKTSFFWDGRAPALRAQALIPIQDHLEMDETLENVVAKLTANPAYPPLFAAAFGSGKISPENIGLAIETFLLTKLSFDSKLDRSLKGQATLTDEEKRGFELFFTESEPRLDRKGADCFHCHGGAFFTDHALHNNGLSPTWDLGLEKTTGKETDRRKFSTPSLRNIALTAPYMHDGRFATLEKVIDHYNSRFERSPTLDPNLAKHPAGLGLTPADTAALIAFLKTLSETP
jgi:YHYH protein/Di-haem cytochrome c peroxidase/Cytochrome c